MSESPFLPDGRQWIWDSSSLRTAKLCARKYYYQVVLGMRAKSLNDNVRFGAEYARALERYHHDRAGGLDHDEASRETVRAALAATTDWRSENPKKNRETLIRSIIWYLEEYRDDPCQTVILANGQPAVELAAKFQLDDDIWLAGHIDRLVSYGGEAYVQDQKTTASTIGSFYFQRYNPDTQMSIYTVLSEVVWNTPVRGVMIDAAQIAVGFTRFARGFTFRTPEQNAEWLRDTTYQIHLTWAAAERDWPMNDAACQMYGGCEFLEVCSKHPSVRREFLNTRFEERRRNPLD